MFRRKPVPKNTRYVEKDKSLSDLGYQVTDNYLLRKIEDINAIYEFKQKPELAYNEQFFQVLIARLIDWTAQHSKLKLIRIPQVTAESEPHTYFFATNGWDETDKDIVLLAPSAATALFWSTMALKEKDMRVASVFGIIQYITEELKVPVVVLCPALYYWDPETLAPTTLNSLQAYQTHMTSSHDIPGISSPETYMQVCLPYIFNKFKGNRVHSISAEFSSHYLLTYLDAHWEELKHKLGSLLIVSCITTNHEIHTPALAEHILTHGRNYVTSTKPVGTLLEDLCATYGIPSFSGGNYEEEIYEKLITFFQLVYTQSTAVGMN
ncbi:argonaute binding protein 2 [Schizosaccharomyces japonicus yFS275]|uniref:Argonaute binding protein 2 n=1 Tax=Schizosaccharomyces japonicus (strain yFS275 / FY16936) TaxID=402676 RepID=B6K5T5_SCHJY|nr:argonaute binding protein 2 [Schizosaccharomyces japonicus yFS275]EEB08889.2 argonaute binding protein 2 [Schizosaccharomyces japonicus yFS275]